MFSIYHYSMKQIILNLCLLVVLMSACSHEKTIHMRDYGIVPDTKENLSAKMQEALTVIKQENEGKKVTLLFEKGRYDFHTEGRFGIGRLERSDRGRRWC